MVVGLAFGLLVQPKEDVSAIAIVEDNCIYVCPTVEWTHTYCPKEKEAYTSDDSSLPCSKEIEVGEKKDKDKVTKYANEVTNSFSVVYEKSEDPNKCHRPSDESLKNDYGMTEDEIKAFKEDHDEHKDSVRTAPDGYYLADDNQCYPIPSITPEPSEEPDPTPTVKPSEPTATPVPGEPTATPKSDEPTSTPGHVSTRWSALGYNANCESTDIEVTFDTKREDGTFEEKVKVTFEYQGNKKTAETNKDGRATVYYGQNGDGAVTAVADGYPSQSTHMIMPICPQTAVKLALVEVKS